jgi:hypothetical protein
MAGAATMGSTESPSASSSGNGDEEPQESIPQVGDDHRADPESSEPVSKRQRGKNQQSTEQQRKDERDKDVPPELLGIKLDQVDNFIISKEKAPDDVKDNPGEIVDVVQAVKPLAGGHPIILESLTSVRLKSFLTQLGITGVARKTKWECRRALAVYVQKSVQINATRTFATNAVVVPEEDQKRFNTITRLSNVLFSDDYRDAFLSLNDSRNRAEIETRLGAKAENFWEEIESEFGSLTASKKDEFGTLETFPEEDNGKVSQRVLSAREDPSDYVVTGAKLLEDWTKLLVKVRETVKEFMSRSGTHDNDVYNFVTAAARENKALKLLGVFPIYYFCLKAKQCSDMDAKFSIGCIAGIQGDSEPNEDLSTTSSIGTKGTASASKRASPRLTAPTDDGVAKAVHELVEYQKKFLDAQITLQKQALDVSSRANDINEKAAMARLETSKTNEQASLAQIDGDRNHARNLLTEELEKVANLRSKFECDTNSVEYKAFSERINEIMKQLYPSSFTS